MIDRRGFLSRTATRGAAAGTSNLSEVTPGRASVRLNELADVVGTLINDLLSRGVVE